MDIFDHSHSLKVDGCAIERSAFRQLLKPNPPAAHRFSPIPQLNCVKYHHLHRYLKSHFSSGVNTIFRNVSDLLKPPSTLSFGVCVCGLAVAGCESDKLTMINGVKLINFWSMFRSILKCCIRIHFTEWVEHCAMTRHIYLYIQSDLMVCLFNAITRKIVWPFNRVAS